MMRLRDFAGRKLAAVLAIAAAAAATLLLVVGPAVGNPLAFGTLDVSMPDDPVATGTPGVNILAQNGFADRNNSWAWSMAWFNGHLYVGTGRDELCVENATIQFFYPQDAGYYNSNPSPNVRCTRNAYDLPLQAEIWQYTPPGAASSTTTTTPSAGAETTTTTTASAGAQTTPKTSSASTGSWMPVYQSPLEANPSDKGHKIARDMAYRGMVVMKNPATGQQALFAAGVTPDEYIPPLLKSHPPVILRTFDGIHWQTLHLPAVIVRFPTSNSYPMGFRTLMVWRNHLFVTATPDITGDGALFEVTNPWSDHPGLRQVSGPQYDIFEVQTFDGGLYIGTGNKAIGYGVYRTFQYTNSGYFNFHQVVGDGAGRGYEVTSVVSMHVYRNRLYVGSSGWYNQNAIPASEMIRIAPSGQWTLVVGNPRNLADGETMYPTSGLFDGFFSPFAAHFWRMQTFSNGLYVGTNDWAYLVQEDKQYAWLQETVLSGVLGFNIWATCDGNDWFPVTRDAFGTAEYNFGGRNLVTGGPNNDTLYIGSANQAQGTTIYADTDDSCGSLIGNDSRSGLERPADLQTDPLEHGTLLTWEKTADARSYEIERAQFNNITIGVKPPVHFPNGWTAEDAMPTVTSVGAPGSVTVTLSVPGAFSDVGSTESNDFVDHSTGKYLYVVVAKSAAGKTSQPSDVQTTAFGGVPATFAALRSALKGSAPVGGDTRTQVRAALASQSRQQLLLEEAEGAVARGDDALAQRDVRELESAAGYNDELSAIAARVVRRLQYATIAGAP